MVETQLRELIPVLGREMSDISEDCYCAGWLVGTEYIVPELCRRAMATGEVQHWGHGEVTPERASGLMKLASLIGGWVDYDLNSGGYKLFEPFPIPPEHLLVIEREAAHVTNQ